MFKIFKSRNLEYMFRIYSESGQQLVTSEKRYNTKEEIETIFSHMSEYFDSIFSKVVKIDNKYVVLLRISGEWAASSIKFQSKTGAMTAKVILDRTISNIRFTNVIQPYTPVTKKEIKSEINLNLLLL